MVDMNKFYEQVKEENKKLWHESSGWKVSMDKVEQIRKEHKNCNDYSGCMNYSDIHYLLSVIDSLRVEVKNLQFRLDRLRKAAMKAMRKKDIEINNLKEEIEDWKRDYTQTVAKWQIRAERAEKGEAEEICRRIKVQDFIKDMQKEE